MAKGVGIAGLNKIQRRWREAARKCVYNHGAAGAL